MDTTTSCPILRRGYMHTPIWTSSYLGHWTCLFIMVLLLSEMVSQANEIEYQYIRTYKSWNDANSACTLAVITEDNKSQLQTIANDLPQDTDMWIHGKSRDKCNTVRVTNGGDFGLAIRNCVEWRTYICQTVRTTTATVTTTETPTTTTNRVSSTLTSSDTTSRGTTSQVTDVTTDVTSSDTTSRDATSQVTDTTNDLTSPVSVATSIGVTSPVSTVVSTMDTTTLEANSENSAIHGLDTNIVGTAVGVSIGVCVILVVAVITVVVVCRRRHQEGAPPKPNGDIVNVMVDTFKQHPGDDDRVYVNTVQDEYVVNTYMNTKQFEPDSNIPGHSNVTLAKAPNENVFADKSDVDYEVPLQTKIHPFNQTINGASTDTVLTRRVQEVTYTNEVNRLYATPLETDYYNVPEVHSHVDTAGFTDSRNLSPGGSVSKTDDVGQQAVQPNNYEHLVFGQTNEAHMYETLF